MLLEHGIVLVIEPQITGMKVDGAAFLVDGAPVIGVTLLKDTVDNFWFTLLHEIAHVVLHYRTGLSSGFFDDMAATEVDEMEEEANAFAGNLLLPDEVWTRSPARIAKTAEPVERLAQQLGSPCHRVRQDPAGAGRLLPLLEQDRPGTCPAAANDAALGDPMATAPLPSYVPALRMKAGELAGLRNLGPDVADRVLPRVIVPPLEERDDTLQAQLFAAEDDPNIADALAAPWRGRSVLVEAIALSPTSAARRSGAGCPRCLSGCGVLASPPSHLSPSPT